jgi:HEPN domain-containing protein
MSDDARVWQEFAERDMAAGEDLVRTGHYAHAVVAFQQAVEKMLKGLIVARTGEQPPRIHSLLRLAEVMELDTTEEQAKLLGDLTNLYAMLRYPAAHDMPAPDLDQSAAEAYAEGTREMMAWLRQQLT